MLRVCIVFSRMLPCLCRHSPGQSSLGSESCDTSVTSQRQTRSLSNRKSSDNTFCDTVAVSTAGPLPILTPPTPPSATSTTDIASTSNNIHHTHQDHSFYEGFGLEHFANLQQPPAPPTISASATSIQAPQHQQCFDLVINQLSPQEPVYVDL